MSSLLEWEASLKVIYEARILMRLGATAGEWRALPDRVGKAKQECNCGKKSKQRISITYFVNGLGESESPSVVIWKAENPTYYFKDMKESCLPVWYYSQKKSWMTSEILHEWSSKKAQQKACSRKKVSADFHEQWWESHA